MPTPYQCATATALDSARDSQVSTRVPSPAGDSPSSQTMAAYTDGESVPGKFHRRCGDTVMLSEGRQGASAPCDCPTFSPPQTTFSNVPVSKGLVFSVKVSQEGEGHVSPVVQKCTCKSTHSDALQSAVYALLGWCTHESSQSTRAASQLATLQGSRF